MSNQQWPHPGQDPRSPWASPDPNWRPPQFHDAPGRDPRAPFGQSAPAGPDLAPPPRRSTRGIYLLIAVVVLIAALVLGMQFFGSPRSSESASASLSPSAPTATRSGNWVPFEGNGDGTFEVMSHRWTETGLSVKVRVEVSSGEYNFRMYVYINKSRESYEPYSLDVFTASVDQPFEETVEFVMPRGESTLVLATPSGRTALNGLPIEG